MKPKKKDAGGVKVATIYFKGQSCTYDLGALLEEVTEWFNNSGDESFEIRFHVMSKRRFERLPETLGWS